jgi:hypothetical protein
MGKGLEVKLDEMPFGSLAAGINSYMQPASAFAILL